MTPRHFPVLFTLAIVIAGCPADDGSTPSTTAQVADETWELHGEIGSLVTVTWSQLADAQGWVEYSFDDGQWLQTPPQILEQGSHDQLLLGIPYDTVITARVVNDFGGGPLAGEPFEARTDPLPDGFPIPELLAADATRWEPSGRYLLGSVNQYDGGWSSPASDFWKFILDREGRVVWAWLTPDRNWTLFMGVSYDGDDLLWDEFTYWSAWDEGMGSQVHRVKIDGTPVQSYSTEGGHHAFAELWDESLVWGAADWSSESLMRMDPRGVVSELWSCGEFLDTHGGANYCQSNTVVWDEPSDSFIYSFYSLETVVQVDHATGATLNHWGHTEGSWSFDPPESAFYWQHGAHFTEAGTLLTSSYVGNWDAELVVREYELDHEAQVLRQVWSFGEGEGIVGDTAGEAHRLANGNTLHNFGSGCRVREITPDGQVVWDVDWSGTKLLGRTVFLDDLYALAPGAE
jgi:hypothetical protein